MLRMTPLASAIVALLLGIEAYAAEETFDTHFMIGGMKDQQVANIRLDDNQPLPGQYDIDIYVNKQWRGKYEIIVTHMEVNKYGSTTQYYSDERKQNVRCYNKRTV